MKLYTTDAFAKECNLLEKTSDLQKEYVSADEVRRMLIDFFLSIRDLGLIDIKFKPEQFIYAFLKEREGNNG